MGTKREDRVDGSGALTAARQWLSMDCSHPGCSSTVLQAAQRLKNQANTKSMTRNLRIKPAPSAWPSVYSSSRPYLKHSVNFHSVLLQVPDAKGLTLQWATHGVRSGTALSFTHSYFDHKRRFAELFVCRTDSAWLITTPLPSLMHILPALMHWDHHCWILPTTREQAQASRENERAEVPGSCAILSSAVRLGSQLPFGKATSMEMWTEYDYNSAIIPKSLGMMEILLSPVSAFQWIMEDVCATGLLKMEH